MIKHGKYKRLKPTKRNFLNRPIHYRSITVGCYGKLRYPNEYVAKQEAGRIYQESDIIMWWYQCKNCGGYHHTLSRQ